MFGFITINDADLDDAERLRYKQAYCGVCRALHTRFGQLARFSLNHDLTFVAMVLMSLYEPAEVQGEASCPMHPLKKQPFTENLYIDYAADMTVALMYYKCLDDASDDGSRTAKMYARALKKGYGDVRRRWPRQTDALEAGLRDIGRIEVTPASNPDAAARRFGDIMAQLVVYDETDFWARPLGIFGDRKSVV